MNSTLKKALGPVAVVVAILAGTTGAASAATITSGHIDVLDVDLLAGALTLSIRSDALADDDIDPNTSTVAVPASTLTTVPNANYSCLGAQGTTAYVLPQSESAAAAAAAPWAGWDTAGVPSTGPAAVNLVLDPAASTMPAGATFALYTTSLSTPTFRLNTNTAGTCAKSAFAVNRNTHGHGAWAFTKAGTYTLKFRATGTGVTSSPWQTYTFVVG